MNAPLWTLERVTLAGLRRPRIAGVTLEIRPGTTAVVGYSGAGKTSLLNLLVAFERPDSGRIENRLPTDDGDRLPLFWIPQNDGLWPHLTCAEHLHVVLPGDAPADEAAALLDRFDLAERAGATPDTLSQGERARLSVARGLASGAAVLVMDEPLAHVDPARVGRYWEAVRTHCRATGAALVFATHVPEAVLREAEQAICLKEGRVLFCGPVPELYHRPATPELAGFLGAANWISAEEAEAWLGERAAGERCYRPEQLAVVRAADGPFVVEAARFAGSIAEAELRDELARRVRRFYHRPSGDALRAEDRVELKAAPSVSRA